MGTLHQPIRKGDYSGRLSDLDSVHIQGPYPSESGCKLVPAKTKLAPIEDKGFALAVPSQGPRYRLASVDTRVLFCFWSS